MPEDAMKLYAEWTMYAAWFQAIGAVGAVCAAIWISHRQHTKQQQEFDDRRALERIIQLKGVMNVVLMAFAHLQIAKDAFESPNRSGLKKFFDALYRPGDLTSTSDDFAYVMKDALMNGIYGLTQIRSALKILDEYLDFFTKGSYTEQNFQDMIVRLQKDFDFTKNVIKCVNDKIVQIAKSTTDTNRMLLSAGININ